jgi:hypothetical protein
MTFLKEIRKAFSAELGRQRAILERSDKGVGPIVSADDEDMYAYGEIPEAAVNRVPRHPDLIAATTTIGVMCGSDSSFHLFKRNGQKWDLIPAQEANAIRTSAAPGAGSATFSLLLRMRGSSLS